MKALLKRTLLLILACMLVTLCFTGCSSRGKKLMELDGTDITVNMYMLMLSRMKGNLASSYAFGVKALDDSFWDTVIDPATRQTYDDFYTAAVLDNVKTYLAAMYLFDDLGLKLPKETVDEIDTEIDRLIETDGKGSKNTLNAILSEFGANVKILREAYIMEAKIAYLNDYLFGADGSLISDENYEKYYQENYVRFRHVFFFTTKPVYQTDANGDTVYYSELSTLTIAYDSDREGAVKKTDEDGNVVKDSKGQIIWVYTDDQGNERISYDEKGTQEKPTQANPSLDKDGNTIGYYLKEYWEDSMTVNPKCRIMNGEHCNYTKSIMKSAFL